MKLENLQIIIADDHPLFRTALRQALSNDFSHSQWFEAENAETLEQLLQQSAQYDLVLLDLQMPGANGYSTLIHLRSHYPHIPVAIISAHEDQTTIAKAIEYGSAGFIPKSSSMPILIEAINEILQGEMWLPNNLTLEQLNTDEHVCIAKQVADLTPQQYRVLQMFAEGMLNKQIAYDFSVSEATIKAHATAIFRKLNVRNRTQAVIAFKQLNIEPTNINEND